MSGQFDDDEPTLCLSPSESFISMLVGEANTVPEYSLLCTSAEVARLSGAEVAKPLDPSRYGEASTSRQESQIFKDRPVIPPIKKFSMQEGFMQQIKQIEQINLGKKRRDGILAHKIITYLCEELAKTSTEAVDILKKPEITTALTGMIRNSAMRSFRATNVPNFTAFNSKGQHLSNATEIFNSDYFTKILPSKFLVDATTEIDCNGRNRLCCIGITKYTDTPRCTRIIKPDKDQLLQHMRTMNVTGPRCFVSIMEALKAIVSMVYCGKDHRRGPEEALDTFLRRKYVKPEPPELEIELDNFDKWLQGLILGTQDPGTVAISAVATSSALIVVTEDDGRILTMTAEQNTSITAVRDSTPFDFLDETELKQRGYNFHIPKYLPSLTFYKLEPYVRPPSKQKDKMNPQQLVETLAGEITRTDSKTRGYIYAYSYKGGFGHLKIGYTKDVGRRIGQWEKECHGSLLVSSNLSESEEAAPHPHQIEKLIHAELKLKRRQSQCTKCHRKHIEWFEVSENEAKFVIRKWTSWMRTEPYSLVDMKLKTNVKLPPVGDFEAEKMQNTPNRRPKSAGKLTNIPGGDRQRSVEHRYGTRSKSRMPS